MSPNRATMVMFKKGRMSSGGTGINSTSVNEVYIDKIDNQYIIQPVKMGI